MSQENVDVAARAIDAFNRTDVEGFTALTTPDFEWSPSMVAVESEIFRGPEGIAKYFDSLSSSWEHFNIVPGSFRDHAEVAVMLGGLKGLGKGSGVPVDSSLGMVFDFRDGRILRIRGYLNHDEALRAAGLAGQE
jgi:ketosteroid isomerase-like protein